jgi:AFG3 family protein
LKGFLIFMLKRSSEMMGGGAAGRGKGRGGGLFGGVMESTAKLINPTDIKVQFK